jgi:hypothetical protein
VISNTPIEQAQSENAQQDFSHAKQQPNEKGSKNECEVRHGSGIRV